MSSNYLSGSRIGRRLSAQARISSQFRWSLCNLRAAINFYQSKLGMDLWLDQGDCAFMQHGNLLFGFCERSAGSFEGIITLLYDTREEVDATYQVLKEIAEGPPEENEAYRIYHFFARDPEGRQFEFQAFLHDLKPYLSGRDLLETRRSIRKFKGESVPEELLWQVIELCRWASSSRNSQGVTYTVIRERAVIHFLAGVRGPVCSSPSRCMNLEEKCAWLAACGNCSCAHSMEARA